MHEAIVITVLNCVKGSKENNKAADFDPSDNDTRAVLDDLLARLQNCYRNDDEHQMEKDQISEHFENVVSIWASRASDSQNLKYFSPSREQDSLLIGFNENRRGFPTMRSMRGVDVEIPMRLKS